jgi:voltage-gated potassium channel Kch
VPELLRQLVIAGVMVLLLAGVHFIVLTRLFQWMRDHEPTWSEAPFAPVPILLVAFSGVLMAHGLEIWLFAAFYIVVGAIPDLPTSLYFSAVTYASVGYGDIIIGSDWRIVGAIEGVAGVILLGCSTAFLVAVVTELDLFRRTPADRTKGPKL